jgi:predicted Zn-dependent protease
MGGLFYKLGKLAGPKIRKAKWAYLAATAPEAEVAEAEYSVGADMARAIRKQFEPCEDPQFTNLLTEIGTVLVRRVKNNKRRYSFECIQAAEPQAFCLPGGFIFISDSMIKRCRQDTNQIAFILAHEMAHVIEGHVMERMLSHSIIKAAMRAGHLRAIATGALGRLSSQLLERAYSQENELRADTLGVRLAAAAGYDSGGAIDLLLHLDSINKNNVLGHYFSTHPSNRTRIENIQNIRKNIL